MSQYPKYDLLIQVNTYTRHSKVTSWKDLLEAGFTRPDYVWEEKDKVIETRDQATLRSGLFFGWMTNRDRILQHEIGQFILPEYDGLFNGLGQVVVTVQNAEDEPATPFSTVMFEFSQKPGDSIRYSLSVGKCLEAAAKLDELNPDYDGLL